MERETFRTTETLAAAAHFRRLSDEALGRLARAFSRREVAGGESVYVTGAPADGLYVIARGTVVITRDDEAGARPLARLGTGDIFGVADLFDSERRSESARTTEDCSLVCGSKGELLSFLEDQPQVELNLRLAAAKDLTQRARVRLAVAQRQVVRHRINLEVRLTFAGAGTVEATLIDLSTLGMSLRGAPDGWRHDELVRYRLEWNDHSLALAGRIAWREGKQLGVQLLDPTPRQRAEIQETLEQMLQSAA